MTETAALVDKLNQRFLQSFPADAAEYIESKKIDEVIPLLKNQSAAILIPVWEKLMPRIAASLTQQLPASLCKDLLTGLAPDRAIQVLSQMSDTQVAEKLAQLEPAVNRELSRLMSYPENSAGRLMDTRVPFYRGAMSVAQAIESLRGVRLKTARSLFLIDPEGRLEARVLMQDLALADPQETLSALSEPVRATISPLADKEEVATIFASRTLFDLPVVDINGVLLGIIVHANLLQTVQDDTSADIQTMVGASKEERALSTPLFAVKKRMPWLQINLLTAFLAASVVGIFENTIAQFTALAVLLPVVAGQSGNAGAQALAVTMRGLALREITIRDWFTVMFKEVRAGLLNGLCIAVTCGIGVFVWSGSLGLVAVISLSMVLAMIAAGFAGAVVPITLVRLGQDPAQSSSIILTTVTDIAGFFSFLGIATLLMQFL
ncbi:MAG: magnesium transporter [Pseudomonadales bacterium]